MQLYYDANLIMEEYGDHEFLIYSPITHKLISVNFYLQFLIQMVVTHCGFLDVNQVSQVFQQQYNLELSGDDIDEQIDLLEQYGILFRSLQALNESHQNARTVAIRQEPTLQKAYLHTTTRCNFHCSYCYNKDVNRTDDELSTDEWIEVVERVKSKGAKELIFTGGEPLLRDDLEQILGCAKTSGHFVELATNGSLLPDRLAGILPLVDMITVSLDSFDEPINTKNRSSYGFQNILQAIDQIHAWAPEKLQIRMVLTKHNRDDLLQFRKHLNDQYRIQPILVNCIPNSLAEVDEMPAFFTPEEIEQYITSNYSLSEGIPSTRCGGAITTIAVDPVGDLYPCQSLLKPEFKITSILREDWYEELLTSQIRQCFSHLSVETMEVCSACSLRYICTGGCPAIGYNLYGKLDRRPEIYCDYFRDLSHHGLKTAAKRL